MNNIKEFPFKKYNRLFEYVKQLHYILKYVFVNALLELNDT
jgi:hypothetical protein